MMKNNILHFTEGEKQCISSFLKKGRKIQNTDPTFAIISWNSLYAFLSSEEQAIIERYLSINPREIGYKLPFLGIPDTIKDIIPIENQYFIFNGIKHTIPRQYLPQEAFEAYNKMNNELYNDINSRLLVLYGYRSPARQVFLFFDILERIYDFNIENTFKRVCFPEYSEHVCTQKQAIDFMTLDGIKGGKFDTSKEYQWLQAYAKKFHFFESYPKNNELDMMYEPWHWRYDRP